MSNLDFDNTEVAFRRLSNIDLYESYLLFKSIGVNSLVKLGTNLVSTALKWNIPVKPLLKPTIFRQFCGGETVEECQQVVHDMGVHRVLSILDYSVEAVASEEAMNATTKEIARSIQVAAKDDNVACGVVKLTGIIDSQLLELVSQGQELAGHQQADWNAGLDRVKSLCDTASKSGVPILIDAEESWIQSAIDDIADEMMAAYNGRDVVVYNTYQMYRHDRLEALGAAFRLAKEGGYRLGVKLVRGAYMEKERERARKFGYASPIHESKKATDQAFDDAMEFCLRHLDDLAVFVGTHNENSIRRCLALMKELSLSSGDRRVLFSQLYGMSDNLSFNLAQHGYYVAKYLPYGPVKSVLPYLFRRAEENSSVQDQSGRELHLIRQELERRGLPH